MRLPDFILANTPSILAEWDAFARSIWPDSSASPAELRDHAGAILLETARDMQSPQTAQQQSDKSKGLRDAVDDAVNLNRASHDHAIGRATAGFDLRAVIAEYRALRASVVRLWLESIPVPDSHDLDDLTRFHESIDQSLAEAAYRFSEHIERSRQLFLRVLGHDLRNPLNAIGILAQSLGDTPDADEETKETGSQIRSSVDAVGHILNDFLDFAVTRLGRPMPVAPAPMDLTELCREVIAEIRTTCPGCTWHMETSGELRGAWDRNRLRQLLSNLISNAVQHGGSTSRITVSARSDGSRVRLHVHNDGAPVAPEALPTLFEPYVRGPESGARAGSIGLGLYIAREVALAHGGGIEVTSTRANGTTFVVTLPLQPGHDALRATVESAVER